MTIRQVLQQTQQIKHQPQAEAVVHTVIDELKTLAMKARVVSDKRLERADGVLTVAIVPPDELGRVKLPALTNAGDRYCYVELHEDGSGWLLCSHPHFMYAFVMNILDGQLNDDVAGFGQGRMIQPAFRWQRLTYDTFLTQQGRIQQGMSRDAYIRNAARLGFTHLEVNGLAWPMGMERGVKGETYPMFYTYCAALDQFVYSELNKGLYPFYYLSANLHVLKENARLAEKYGLIPGMLCFEPRDVPEEFFSRYPMLRGARVDHPFRSFKPRYNMTITQPVVLEHYAEMMTKIMTEVPRMGYVTIWSNDSGAGFEHTKSLYVGRNGGAYLIREWKSDEEIAKLAGENVLRFLSTLRDAGRKINPEFRVITRMESFYGEHDTVFAGLGNSLDIETTSLAARGWDMPYTHPKYPELREINGGTIYQQQFDKAEKPPVEQLRKQGSIPHYNFAAGPHVMFDPLMGVPSPWLVHKRLKMLYDNGVDSLAHQGGTFPPEQVPFNINHEVSLVFQYDPKINADELIHRVAMRWAGSALAEILVKAWQYAEMAIIGFPNVTGLYSTFGFTWCRLWARPFVPNMEAIPAQERAYYEDFMCTTPHNPNNVDLSRDVLFVLTTPEKCESVIERMDANVWEPLNKAIDMLTAVTDDAEQVLGASNVIYDQWIRLRALRCWLRTQRSVAAWVTGVYGYLNATNKTGKRRARKLLTEMIHQEIANTRELAELLRSGVSFMAQTDQGETPLMYGTNLLDLLPKRIALMERHMNDEPYIDPHYIERQAARMIGS